VVSNIFYFHPYLGNVSFCRFPNPLVTSLWALALLPRKKGRSRHGGVPGRFLATLLHARVSLSVLMWGFPKIVGFPPKSSILIGFLSIINHPFWGPYFWTHPCVLLFLLGWKRIQPLENGWFGAWWYSRDTPKWQSLENKGIQSESKAPGPKPPIFNWLKNVSISLRIHGIFVYLNGSFLGVDVGKYSRHRSNGYVCTCLLFCFQEISDRTHWMDP